MLKALDPFTADKNSRGKNEAIEEIKQKKMNSYVETLLSVQIDRRKSASEWASTSNGSFYMHDFFFLLNLVCI